MEQTFPSHRHLAAMPVSSAVVPTHSEEVKNMSDYDMCISSGQVRKKVRDIYAAAACKLETESPPPFHASVGWFSKFKKRHSLKTARYSGEAADAPSEEEEFMGVLKQMIQDGGDDLC